MNKVQTANSVKEGEKKERKKERIYDKKTYRKKEKERLCRFIF